VGGSVGTLDAILRELRTLAAGQQRIIELLERQQQPQPVDDDAVFVAAIAAAVGQRVFTSLELLEHAAVDSNLNDVLGDVGDVPIAVEIEAAAPHCS
jgi:hypothetical protein